MVFVSIICPLRIAPRRAYALWALRTITEAPKDKGSQMATLRLSISTTHTRCTGRLEATTLTGNLRAEDAGRQFEAMSLQTRCKLGPDTGWA